MAYVDPNAGQGPDNNMGPQKTGAQPVQAANARQPGMQNAPPPPGKTQPTASAQAPAAVSQPGAGVQAQGVGTGFINLQNVLAANRPAASQMANALTAQNENLNAQATQAATAYQGGGAGPSDDVNKKVGDAEANAKGMGSFAGLQGILRKSYSDQAYTQGQGGLDAFLANSAGGDQFQHAASAYGQLQGILNAASQNAQNAAARQPVFKQGNGQPQPKAPKKPTVAPAPRKPIIQEQEY